MKTNLTTKLSIALLSSILLISCDKKTDCAASIKCVDKNGQAIEGASVQLYATVNNSPTIIGDVKANGTSDANGEIKFTFKLPAIFDIHSTKVISTNTLSSKSIIKLEEGKTATKVVTME
jgi:hypothetical protein